MHSCGKSGETCGESGETCGESGETSGKSGETCGESGEKCGESGEKCGESGEKCGKICREIDPRGGMMIAKRIAGLAYVADSDKCQLEKRRRVELQEKFDAYSNMMLDEGWPTCEHCTEYVNPSQHELLDECWQCGRLSPCALCLPCTPQLLMCSAGCGAFMCQSCAGICWQLARLCQACFFRG